MFQGNTIEASTSYGARNADAQAGFRPGGGTRGLTERSLGTGVFRRISEGGQSVFYRRTVQPLTGL